MAASAHTIEVYTCKTSLAYTIERDFLKVMFAYVAREADPPSPPQDPTSSPENIYQLFCRIAHTRDSRLKEEDRNLFIVHLQKLDAAAFRTYRNGDIDAATFREIQRRLGKATHKDLQPVMLRAKIAEARLKPGDNKTTKGYPDNWERVVDDLKLDEVTVIKDGCD